MAVITLVSGGAAPGLSTACCALAAVWPRRVMVVDADPAAGQLLPGWLGPAVSAGRLHPGRTLISYVTATRHTTGSAAALAEHLQQVPDTTSVQVLLGLRDVTQAGSVDEAGWWRLAQALTDPALTNDDEPVDVVIDAGRLGPASPWPLLNTADTVLVATRPTLRSVTAANGALTVLSGRLEPDRLGVLACASGIGESREVQRALTTPVRAVLARDPAAATVFSDGATPQRGFSRSPLLRSARTGAHRLARHSTEHIHHGRGEAMAR